MKVWDWNFHSELKIACSLTRSTDFNLCKSLEKSAFESYIVDRRHKTVHTLVFWQFYGGSNFFEHHPIIRCLWSRFDRLRDTAGPFFSLLFWPLSVWSKTPKPKSKVVFITTTILLDFRRRLGSYKNILQICVFSFSRLQILLQMWPNNCPLKAVIMKVFNGYTGVVAKVANFFGETTFGH